jgi:hypothetical protein
MTGPKVAVWRVRPEAVADLRVTEVTPIGIMPSRAGGRFLRPPDLMIVAGYFGGWSLLGPIGVTVSSGLVTSRSTLLVTCADRRLRLVGELGFRRLSDRLAPTGEALLAG